MRSWRNFEIESKATKLEGCCGQSHDVEHLDSNRSADGWVAGVRVDATSVA